MPDYKQLIDAATWQFIDTTNSFFPPEAAEFSIEKQRKLYDTLCERFNAGRPDVISVTNGSIQSDAATIPVRRYTNDTATNDKVHIIYFHGGGFIVGSLESHDDFCAEIAADTGIGVTAVDYRLAPEHPHPAAFLDAMASTLHIAATGNQSLLLCGDSAGANLAAAVTHALRDKIENIIGQVLIYPGLGGDTQNGSYIEHANAPMLSTQDILYYDAVRAGDSANNTKTDATFSPLKDTDFSGIAPTVVFSAACDPLADDGRYYCDAINSSGGQAIWVNEAGLVHGYLRARNSVDKARLSVDNVKQALIALSNKRMWTA